LDTKTMLGIVAALVIGGVSGGLALYRDVGVLRDQVEHLQRDVDLRDLRERGMRDSLIRLEERHAALSARGCTP
jgi:hypothetical protein